MNINAVIMCSGLSKRAGENKLLHKIGSKPLYMYTFDEVAKCDFTRIIAVTSYDEIYRCADLCGFSAIFNYANSEGISASIRLGTIEADNEAGIMFFVCDQPQLKNTTIKKICSFFNGENIVVPRYNGDKGNPCIFPPQLRNELMSLSADNGGKSIIARHKNIVTYVDFDFYLTDIDTKEDLIRLDNLITCSHRRSKSKLT